MLIDFIKWFFREDPILYALQHPSLDEKSFKEIFHDSSADSQVFPITEFNIIAWVRPDRIPPSDRFHLPLSLPLISLVASISTTLAHNNTACLPTSSYLIDPHVRALSLLTSITPNIMVSQPITVYAHLSNDELRERFVKAGPQCIEFRVPLDSVSSIATLRHTIAGRLDIEDSCIAGLYMHGIPHILLRHIRSPTIRAHGEAATIVHVPSLNNVVEAVDQPEAKCGAIEANAEYSDEGIKMCDLEAAELSDLVDVNFEMHVSDTVYNHQARCTPLNTQHTPSPLMMGPNGRLYKHFSIKNSELGCDHPSEFGVVDWSLMSATLVAQSRPWNRLVSMTGAIRPDI